MSDTKVLSSKVLLSPRESSTLTGFSLTTIAKLLASRELGSIRVGRHRLIPLSELKKFTQCDHPTTSVPRNKVGR
jgi:excisionase family DNA binding protein